MIDSGFKAMVPKSDHYYPTTLNILLLPDLLPCRPTAQVLTVTRGTTISPTNHPSPEYIVGYFHLMGDKWHHMEQGYLRLPCQPGPVQRLWTRQINRPLGREGQPNDHEALKSASPFRCVSTIR